MPSLEISRPESNTALGACRSTKAAPPKPTSSTRTSTTCKRICSTRTRISSTLKTGSSVRLLSPLPPTSYITLTPPTGHVETTWHSLGTCSMAPREGNSIVKHGVLDDRLNVHGVKGLKVADLSICPDNVGCNTYSTALLIGEKCAVLTAEDLGYSGSALDMKVPTYHAPREVTGLSRL